LLSLLDSEVALQDLDAILWKPHTHTTFDKVVDWLEQAFSPKTFKDESRLPRCKMLMKCLEAKFKTTKYKLFTVALETGTEQGSGPDAYERGKSVKVPVWDFQQVVDSFLLNPILFGNKDNLINRDIPFQKFI
jgi:hypothetical protein